VSEELRLEQLDPESTTCFSAMVEIIEEEISVRIALEDTDIRDPEWAKRIAELAADTLLDRFVVRTRTPETPRSRWASGDDTS